MKLGKAFKLPSLNLQKQSYWPCALANDWQCACACVCGENCY